jgi:hypothetical protein
MLCGSFLKNDGVVTTDKTIRYDAAKSVLGTRIGEPTRISESQLWRLAQTYFDEIETKYRAA